MEIYFKDSFVASGSKVLDIEDRSFRFGDGIFETAIVANGKLYDWPNHQKRLEAGVEYFRLNIDVSKVAATALELIARNKVSEGYMRVIISRGDAAGVVGYKAGSGEAFMTIGTIPKPLPEFKPLKLYVASQRLFYNYPCKTNNALVYTMAYMEAADNDCENALLLNHEGYICETANANIFWLKNGTLYTPSTDLPFVPGTMRKRIFELWNGKIIEGKFKPEDLNGAEEIFMTNVGGIVASITEVRPLNITLKTTALAKDLYDKLIEEIKSL